MLVAEHSILDRPNSLYAAPSMSTQLGSHTDEVKQNFVRLLAPQHAKHKVCEASK